MYFTAVMEKAIRFCVIGFSEMKHYSIFSSTHRKECVLLFPEARTHDSCLVYLRPDQPNYWDGSKHIIHSSPPAHLNILSIYLVFGSGLNESFNNPCSQQVKLQPAGSQLTGLLTVPTRIGPRAPAFLKGIRQLCSSSHGRIFKQIYASGNETAVRTIRVSGNRCHCLF